MAKLNLNQLTDLMNIINRKEERSWQLFVRLVATDETLSDDRIHNHFITAVECATVFDYKIEEYHRRWRAEYIEDVEESNEQGIQTQTV